MDKAQTRVALIAGAAGGLGLATAVELGRRGWSIFIQHSPDDTEVEHASRAILDAAKKAGQKIRVTAAAADLTSAADRDQLVEAVLDEFGRIDMLINASTGAATAPQDLLEVTVQTYARVMEARTTAALFLTQLVANEMVRLVEAGLIEGAKIVTFNSISAEATSTDHAPHCISRAALTMITRLFADRLGEHGIAVYEIRVGLISTGADDPAHAKYDSLIEQGLTPIRRWGRTGDAARAAVAIAEDLLGFSTGEVINVDGGFHLRRL